MKKCFGYFDHHYELRNFPIGNEEIYVSKGKKLATFVKKFIGKVLYIKLHNALKA